MAFRVLKPRVSSESLNHRKKLEQDLEHITQEMYRRNKELAETNRTLSLLQAIDSLVLESHDSVQALSAQITAAIVGTTDYPLVALLGQQPLHDDQLEVYGLSTAQNLHLPSDLLKQIRPSVHHEWFRSAERRRFLSLSHLDDEDSARLLGSSVDLVREFKKTTALKAIYVVKLVARKKLVGIMVVSSFSPVSDFEAAEARLLERLSEAVGIALDNKLLFEENQRVLKQLQKINVRLRELDKTKDEFISMASHQLRTPLTTVKGYLSMVLDGDAGQVKKDQKELLKHAFDGAQRMVYLISDLLNVSRMQSGKFVIENKATNLADLVKSEVDQLQEQAASKSIKLLYRQPGDFPVLGLDEDKVRQVVMNFIDNALYYTPKGGTVEAKLSADPEAVNFEVVDTGIGVPKEAQKHLFVKFYRADNAKKTRPDGTGLGLFMAKKVIAAQGGTLIFQSAEGKGSTFGFRLPRKALGIKAGDKLPAAK